MEPAVAYFDSSVLVKRYVNEQGAVRARSLIRSHGILSSRVAPAETMSALRRRRAAGELSDLGFATALARLRKDRGY
jgi:predicted nucleic acid-binding protein